MRSINRGLRAMEWQRYLAVMWIICGELKDSFSGELGEADASLIESTRALIRDIALGREDYVPDALALSSAWDRQCQHEEEVSHGLAAFWAIAQYLAGEATGEAGKHHAAGWLGNAVTELWRTPEDRMRHEFHIYDPAEEIDESSPRGRFLELLQQIVTSAASYSGDLDPVLMRAEILGK